ncbi:hypothetical protein AYO22_00100 [Fonsecaea multimorphosa]|nr:hypothetical protein AYO22_00100 [Fonsecaea multimorphosa]
MDRSCSQLEPSDHEKRPARNLKGHDSEERDSEDLDLNKVPEIIQGLDASLLQGEISAQKAIDAVEAKGEHIARGHSGSVQKVKFRTQWLARKTIWLSIEDNHKAYSKEIECLEKLRRDPHWHVIQMRGHYIHPANEGHLLLSPLADCSLEQFVVRPLTVRDRLVMQRWFGCLSAGLKYIHGHRIKHKDIKLDNILVHGENVVITDFGIAHSFPGTSPSKGQSFGAWLYQAPEVIKGARRGRSQDVWSLICCFIEMASELFGGGRTELRTWCRAEDGWRFNFSEDHRRVELWLRDLLARSKAKEQRALLNLLLQEFEREEAKRPSASDLLDKLQDMRSFVGECCVMPDSARESAVGQPPPFLSQKGSKETARETAPEPVVAFINTFRKMVSTQRQPPSIQAGVDRLTAEAERQQVRSLRSVETKLLFYILPV